VAQCVPEPRSLIRPLARGGRGRQMPPAFAAGMAISIALAQTLPFRFVAS
jgi:hypothetical protein